MKKFLTILVTVGLVLGCSQFGAYKSPNGDYFEVERDNRIYVLGSAEPFESFQKAHHLPYTNTLIGEGPNGQTVVFEASNDGSALQNRLAKIYGNRHGSS